MYDELNKEIKKVRKAKKLRQHDVADSMGCSRTMYIRIESGETSPLPYYDKLVEAIGEELLELLPSDFERYTNHNLLIYINYWGAKISEVAKNLHMPDTKLKRLLANDKKKYLIEYKQEIDKLFPEMSTIDTNAYEKVGKNSLQLVVEEKTYIFMNVCGKSDQDSFKDFIEEDEDV